MYVGWNSLSKIKKEETKNVFGMAQQQKDSRYSNKKKDTKHTTFSFTERTIIPLIIVFGCELFMSYTFRGSAIKNFERLVGFR